MSAPAAPPPVCGRLRELFRGDPAELAAFLGGLPALDPGLELACAPRRALVDGHNGLPPAPARWADLPAHPVIPIAALYEATSEYLAGLPAGLAAPRGPPDLDVSGRVFFTPAPPGESAASRRQRALGLLLHGAQRLLAAAYGPPSCGPRGRPFRHHPFYSAVYAGGLPAVEAAAAWCSPSAEVFADALVEAFSRPGGGNGAELFPWLAARAGPLHPRALHAAAFSAWGAEGVPLVLAHPGFPAAEALAAFPGLAARLAGLGPP